MPIKKIDDLAEGDVLCSDITNNQGVVLVRAGAAVTDAHRRLFKMWGILTVQVSAAGDAPDGHAVTEEHLDRAESRLKRCFGDSLENEVMAEVFRVAVEMRAAQLAAGVVHESN